MRDLTRVWLPMVVAVMAMMRMVVAVTVAVAPLVRVPTVWRVAVPTIVRVPSRLRRQRCFRQSTDSVRQPARHPF